MKRFVFMKRITLFFAFIIISVSATNAQQKTYTLDEAIKTALDNNIDTKMAIMEVEKAQAAVNEAFGYAYPSIDISGSFSHFLAKPKVAFPDMTPLMAGGIGSFMEANNIATTDGSAFKFNPSMIPPAGEPTLTEMAQANNYEAKAELTQILFSSAVLTGIGASEIYLQTSKELLKGKAVSTILNVKKAFYGVLLTRELLNIVEASLQNARENLKNLKSLYSQGLVAEFDVMQAEVQVENINPTVLQIRNSLKNTKEALKMIMGVDQTKDIGVEGELKLFEEGVPEVDKSINKAIESNYDIKSLEMKQQVDEAFIELDRAEYWPTVAAFANYSFAGMADDLRFQNYSQSLVGLSVSMNLFQGMRTKYKEQQSIITSLQTEQQLYQLKDYVTTQVKEKQLELERVKSILESQERNEKLAGKAYELAKVRFKEGTGTQLEIKNADMELRTARTNKLQSVFNYIIAKSELDALMGKVKPEYLQRVENLIPKED